MHRIRPYQVFTLVAEQLTERLVQIPIPPRKATGSVTLLETFLIVSAIKAVRAKRLFEFGTMLGSTTFNLALNSPEDARIFTFDLDEQSAKEITQHVADAPLTEIHLRSTANLDFMGTVVAQKIRTVYGNSITFDFTRWNGQMDFIFIDGGHDYITVKADTENSMAMAALDKPSCIMWHDYTNPQYPELSAYLDKLSEREILFHIGDTMLCVWFNDPAGTILPQLLAS